MKLIQVHLRHGTCFGPCALLLTAPSHRLLTVQLIAAGNNSPTAPNETKTVGVVQHTPLST